MSSSSGTPSRSAGQWAVTLIFGLLSLAFLARGIQLGFKWLRHAIEGEINFKAMTLWALVYMVLCAVIAAVAYFMPRDTDESVVPNVERGA